MLDCQYLLQASDSSKVVQVTFTSVNTEECFDYVKVYDGQDATAQLISPM